MAMIQVDDDGAWHADAAHLWLLPEGAVPGPGDDVFLYCYIIVFDDDIEVNSVSISEDSSLTLDGDRELIGDLLLEYSGILADGGFQLSVNGDVEYASGTYTTTGSLRLIGDGNLAWSSITEYPNHLIQDTGVATTLIGDVDTSKITLGDGSFTGAYQLYLRAKADNFFVQDENHTLDINGLKIYTEASYSNGPIHGSSLATYLRIQTTDETITFTGDVDIGTAELQIYGCVAGEVSLVDMTAFGITAGDVILGTTSADDQAGSLDFGTGSHTVTGTLEGGNAANKAANVLKFGGSTVNLTGGTIDGALIDNLSCTDAKCRIFGGTIKNLNDPGGTVYCIGTAVTDCHANFVSMAVVDNRMLMSVGS